MQPKSVALAVVGLLLLALGCSVAIVKPGWQTASGEPIESLTVTAQPGAQARATVKFIPGDNESNGLAITLGGDQVSWVSSDPATRIPKVDLGVAYPITLTVNVPPGTPPGTYGASISLYTGQKLVSKLPVKIVVQ